MKKLSYWKYYLTLVSIILAFNEVQAQNGWTKKADIPTPRPGSSACVINDKIYVLGGTNSSYSDLAANETYDPLTNTWEAKQPLTTPRGWLSTAVVNGIIYAIGGGYPTSTNKTEAYDPVTNSWTSKANMLSPRRAAQAVAVSGIVYNIGGNQSARNCEAYNPVSNTWTAKTPIPVGGGGDLALTAYNGLIYTFGGGYVQNPSSNVYAYNPQTDTWIQKQSMPTARFAFQTYLVDGKIYAVGGSQGEGNTLATVEVYDPVNDTWETKPNMPFKSCMFAGAVVNSKIYVISGTSDWATGTNEIWEYDPGVFIEINPTSLNFGSVGIGNLSEMISVTIKNHTSQAIKINSISLNKSEFSLLNLPILPVTLATSDSIKFGVSFQPNKRGFSNDLVIVELSDASIQNFSIPIEGYGILLGSSFKEFVNRVNNATIKDRTEIVDSFLNKYTSMPLIEQDTICQFLYQGEASTINLANDANLWNVNASPLIKLSTTNLWYYSDVFEPDARIDYKFVIDGNNWILDPKNPKTCLGGYGPNSEVAMPDYVYAPEINFYSEIEHGKLNDTTFYSSILGNSRRVVIYIPYLYNSVGLDSFSVALFHDGSDWINFASAKNTLDYLIHH